MARPLQLHTRITIDYLDYNLNGVVIKHKTNDTVEGVKQGLLALAYNIEDLVAKELTMAKPLDLRLKIRIDYLDEDLLETVIKYGGSGGVKRIKEILMSIAANLDAFTKTDNSSIWKSYENHKD